MIPFLNASNFFTILISLLPLSMRTFIVLYLIFFVVFGVVKEFFSG